MKTRLYIVKHVELIRYATYETQAKQATPFSVAATYNGPDLRPKVSMLSENGRVKKGRISIFWWVCDSL